MLSDTQYTSAKVKEVEAAAKSTLDEESDDEDFPGNVGMQIYTLDAGLAPKINRAYFFDNETKDANGNAVNNVSEIMVMWSNVNLAFWEVQPGNYSLTNEFKALLEKSGFIFLLENNGLNFYYNDAKKLVVVPSIKTFSDINAGLPIFMMNYFAYDAGGASAGVKAKIAKEITARIEAQYKKLGAK